MADPWAATEQGWKDLVTDPGPPSPKLPAGVGLVRWKDPLPAPPAPEPAPEWSRSDHKLWLTAGSLMALATLVLAVLGVLSFRGHGPPPALINGSTDRPVLLATPEAHTAAARLATPSRATLPPAAPNVSRSPTTARAAQPSGKSAAAHAQAQAPSSSSTKSHKSKHARSHKATAKR
jgi:hypothetical protein